MTPWNQPPLAANAFNPLGSRSVQARGWLLEQLSLAAAGLTGRMMDIWPDVGPQSGWLGGSGENWERGPYYARGLVALAHALGDEKLIARAQPWIAWSLVSQREDGYFGPADNDDWWPRMPMLDALRWWHAATGEPRILRCMSDYLRYLHANLATRPLQMWGKPRGGDCLDTALWLYNHTAEPFLLELADGLHRQTSDWIGELGGDGAPDETFDFGHGVNRAMGLKEPAVYFQRSRDPRHLAVLRHGWDRLIAYHGQINGMFSGDEFLHGPGATQGTELCTIVELLASFEAALRVSGELWIADAIERIAFNALPATIAADHRSHQYFQLPNQIECTPGGRAFSVHHETDLLFGVATGYGCCAANFHMGWPRLLQHLWWATPDGGLAALLLGPSQVTAPIADSSVTILENTAYPFEEEIRFEFKMSGAIEFPFVARIPAWAESYELTLNGRQLEADWLPSVTVHGRPCGGRAIRIARRWSNGDLLSLRLPMTPRATSWDGSIVIERGPLVYALSIGEDWRAVGGHPDFPDFEVHPTTAWNYGLQIDPAAPQPSIGVETSPPASQPWTQDGSGLALRIPAKRIPQWSAVNGMSGPVPRPLVRSTEPTEEITLIPYGCARLRISMFPRVD